jgi:cytoskeleton-associated protein 5
MAEEQEDFSKLPLPDRFVHKNWKVRKEGYEAATKEFKTAQPSDPLVKDFVADSNIWKGAVADSNVAAQAEGLNALNAFLEIAGKPGCTRCAILCYYPSISGTWLILSS